MTYVWIALGLVALLSVAFIGVSVSKKRGRPGSRPGGISPDAAIPGAGALEADAAETDAEPADAPETAPEQAAEEPRDVPAAVQGRMSRLRARLSASNGLGKALLNVLSRANLSEDDWDDIEEVLLGADLGIGPATELIDSLKARLKVEGSSSPEVARRLLREELIAILDPSLDRSLSIDSATDDHGNPVPAVVLVVGVNGTGKTTTVGKLARILVAEDKSILLGAADTFRAAAADQLQTWGSRVGVPTVRADKDGADPASVAFEAVATGIKDQVDVVLVDTAGRLQNKAGLMDELGKITRVITRQAPLSEVLLVLDATTGQNGLTQARVFGEVAGVTGIVLTKLDGTARGGIVMAVQRELGVPVKLVGLGEGPDDLAPFDIEDFVDGILAED